MDKTVQVDIFELDRLQQDYRCLHDATKQVANYLASEQTGLQMTALQRGWIYEVVKSALENTHDPYEAEKRE